jgi:hypothetical protein
MVSPPKLVGEVTNLPPTLRPQHRTRTRSRRTAYIAGSASSGSSRNGSPSAQRRCFSSCVPCRHRTVPRTPYSIFRPDGPPPADSARKRTHSGSSCSAHGAVSESPSRALGSTTRGSSGRTRPFTEFSSVRGMRSRWVRFGGCLSAFGTGCRGGVEGQWS